MKNAVIAAIVAALVTSGGAYAGTRAFAPTRTIITHSTVVSIAPGDRGWASANCPLGTTATGGGFLSSDLGTGDAYLTDSTPAPIGSRQSAIGWTVAARNPGSGPVSIQAYAVCAR